MEDGTYSSDSDSDTPVSENKCNQQCAENHSISEVIEFKRCEYYMNDSVYISFNMCFFNEEIIRPEPLDLKKVHFLCLSQYSMTF